MNQEIIKNLKNQAISRILDAKTPEDVEQARITFLGRQGDLTKLFSNMASLKPEEKKQFGQLINETKRIIEEALNNQLQSINTQSVNNNDWLDVTLPGIRPKIGNLHLITQTMRELTEIFEHIGFTRIAYPEIEWDWYAFEGLNMPNNHPARDEWETFFIKDLSNQKFGRSVLTPHTSSGQLREMQGKTQPPIRMLNIAKCYRRQADVSHAPMFYQFETLVVDKGINITHLKGTLDYFAKQFFGPERKTRIRPFHFQFTEPSFEVDVTCIVCKGKGCAVCKEGWLELGGAGMVHPNVLRNGGIDPEIYTGFASGFGLERVLMMKYGINDIRHLFNGDIRFLKQF